MLVLDLGSIGGCFFGFGINWPVLVGCFFGFGITWGVLLGCLLWIRDQLGNAFWMFFGIWHHLRGALISDHFGSACWMLLRIWDQLGDAFWMLFWICD